MNSRPGSSPLLGTKGVVRKNCAAFFRSPDVFGVVVVVVDGNRLRRTLRHRCDSRSLTTKLSRPGHGPVSDSNSENAARGPGPPQRPVRLEGPYSPSCTPAAEASTRHGSEYQIETCSR